MNITPLVTQLLKNEAIMYALAKSTLNETQFKEFEKNVKVQFKISIKEFIHTFPDLITDSDSVLKELDKEG